MKLFMMAIAITNCFSDTTTSGSGRQKSTPLPTFRFHKNGEEMEILETESQEDNSSERPGERDIILLSVAPFFYLMLSFPF